jgi:hypothetical protein
MASLFVINDLNTAKSFTTKLTFNLLVSSLRCLCSAIRWFLPTISVTGLSFKMFAFHVKKESTSCVVFYLYHFSPTQNITKIPLLNHGTDLNLLK